VPELGTDQVLAVGALGLLIAAAAVAAGQKLLVELTVSLALAGACVGAVVALAPEQGGRLEGAAARNWSPLYRLQSEDSDGSADAKELSESSGFDVLDAQDTRYHRMVVATDGESRFLRFDNSFQSGMWVKQPFRTRFAYTDYLDLALAYRPEAKRVLFIGLGGGSAPKRIWRDFPNLELQVVELDGEVVDAAYKWFALPRSPRLEVDVDDGRRWLNRHDEKWDAIVLDAFYADSIPFHLATREFLELAATRLEPGGVVVSNFIGAMTGEQSRLLRSVVRTYRSVFPTVLVHPVFEGGDKEPTEIRNIIIVGSEGAAPSKDFLAERWNRLREQTGGKAPDLTGAIANRWEQNVPTGDVPLLTDDYAPTDALLLLFG
jgi:spermidine synthase